MSSILTLKYYLLDEVLPRNFIVNFDGDLNNRVSDTDDDENKDWRLPQVRFMKYYLLDEGQKDDKAMVCQQLKDLFDEINTKSGIDGAPKDEFKLFMDSFDKNMNVRDIFNNVVFASKKARIELMDCFLKQIIGNARTCDDLVSNAFGEDWVSKLEQHPSTKVVLLPKYKLDSLPHLNGEQNRSELDAINDIITCIHIIRRLYLSFGDKKGHTKEIKNIDQLAGIIHFMFPNHIAALTRRAYKECSTLPRFEPYQIGDWLDVNPYDDYDRRGYNYCQRR